MTICADFALQLDDYLDGRLDADRCERLLTHSLACRSCNARLALQSLLRQRLKNLAPPPMPADLADRVFTAVRSGARRQQRVERRRRSAAPWLHYGALAASWAMLAILILPRQPAPGPQPAAAGQFAAAPAAAALPQPAVIEAAPGPAESRIAAAPRARDSIRVVRVEQGETESVKLVFRSPSALTGVTMELDLPAGIQLVGYPGRNSLSWQTDLDQGANVLELPVQVNGAGGVVTATVNLGGDRRSFSVLVQGTRTRALPASAERTT